MSFSNNPNYRPNNDPRGGAGAWSFEGLNTSDGGPTSRAELERYIKNRFDPRIVDFSRAVYGNNWKQIVAAHIVDRVFSVISHLPPLSQEEIHNIAMLQSVKEFQAMQSTQQGVSYSTNSESNRTRMHQLNNAAEGLQRNLLGYFAGAPYDPYGAMPTYGSMESFSQVAMGAAGALGQLQELWMRLGLDNNVLSEQLAQAYPDGIPANAPFMAAYGENPNQQYSQEAARQIAAFEKEAGRASTPEEKSAIMRLTQAFDQSLNTTESVDEIVKKLQIQLPEVSAKSLRKYVETFQKMSKTEKPEDVQNLVKELNEASTEIAKQIAGKSSGAETSEKVRLAGSTVFLEEGYNQAELGTLFSKNNDIKAIRGDLTISGNAITELPSNLAMVTGTLDLEKSTIQELPDSLRSIGEDFKAPQHKIQMPDNLHIQGRAHIPHPAELENLTVDGELSIVAQTDLTVGSGVHVKKVIFIFKNTNVGNTDDMKNTVLQIYNNARVDGNIGIQDLPGTQADELVDALRKELGDEALNKIIIFGKPADTQPDENENAQNNES